MTPRDVYATAESTALRGSDLRGIDLSGSNMRGADLRGCDLAGAEFDGATLTDAIGLAESDDFVELREEHTDALRECAEAKAALAALIAAVDAIEPEAVDFPEMATALAAAREAVL